MPIKSKGWNALLEVIFVEMGLKFLACEKSPSLWIRVILVKSKTRETSITQRLRIIVSAGTIAVFSFLEQTILIFWETFDFIWYFDFLKFFGKQKEKVLVSSYPLLLLELLTEMVPYCFKVRSILVACIPWNFRYIGFFFKLTSDKTIKLCRHPFFN